MVMETTHILMVTNHLMVVQVVLTQMVTLEVQVGDQVGKDKQVVQVT